MSKTVYLHLSRSHSTERKRERGKNPHCGDDKSDADEFFESYLGEHDHRSVFISTLEHYKFSPPEQQQQQQQISLFILSIEFKEAESILTFPMMRLFGAINGENIE